ncbi:MAG: hypothetical protein JWO80_1334 [Bryobacterales bacterium]|nr:hypothetical protein [Bryobacterales bacterium]
MSETSVPQLRLTRDQHVNARSRIREDRFTWQREPRPALRREFWRSLISKILSGATGYLFESYMASDT